MHKKCLILFAISILMFLVISGGLLLYQKNKFEQSINQSKDEVRISKQENELNKKNISDLTKENQRIQKEKDDLNSKLQACNLKTAEIEYYFADECPHCKNVEKFMEENDVNNKMTIIKKEVSYNYKNSLEWEKKYKECLKTNDSPGVPFLYVMNNGNEPQCFAGETDIIEFFKKGLEIQ